MAVVLLTSLGCSEPVRENACVTCLKCCLQASSFAPMLRLGEAVYIYQGGNGGQPGDGEGACGPDTA